MDHLFEWVSLTLSVLLCVFQSKWDIFHDLGSKFQVLVTVALGSAHPLCQALGSQLLTGQTQGPALTETYSLVGETEIKN